MNTLIRYAILRSIRTGGFRETAAMRTRFKVSPSIENPSVLKSHPREVIRSCSPDMITLRERSGGTDEPPRSAGKRPSEWLRLRREKPMSL
jgi:hypothetical protein